MKTAGPRFLALPLLAAAALAATASCAAEPWGDRAGEPGAARPRPTVATVATDLEAPWSIAFHEGTPLLSERDSARIVELDQRGEPRTVAAIEGVHAGGEGGLLGIAVHDGYLYTYFTTETGNRIERFPIVGEAGSLRLGGPETLLDSIPAAGFQNGGRIAFGPDGMLYATVGDAGDRPAAQDLDSLAGKILRMTPDGGVPDDNPIPGSLVYSYGHRNPQGIAWDDNGAMYASEFGQNTWDELNVIVPGGNYGWPEVEGIAGQSGSLDPVQQWRPRSASPSGMAVVGDSIWIANLRGERLRQIPLDDLHASVEHWTGEHGRLRDAVRAPGGELWVLTNNTDGRGEPGPDDDRILRFDPAAAQRGP